MFLERFKKAVITLDDPVEGSVKEERFILKQLLEEYNNSEQSNECKIKMNFKGNKVFLTKISNEEYKY